MDEQLKKHLYSCSLDLFQKKKRNKNVQELCRLMNCLVKIEKNLIGAIEYRKILTFHELIYKIALMTQKSNTLICSTISPQLILQIISPRHVNTSLLCNCNNLLKPSDNTLNTAQECSIHIFRICSFLYERILRFHKHSWFKHSEINFKVLFPITTSLL